MQHDLVFAKLHPAGEVAAVVVGEDRRSPVGLQHRVRRETNQPEEACIQLKMTVCDVGDFEFR